MKGRSQESFLGCPSDVPGPLFPHEARDSEEGRRRAGKSDSELLRSEASQDVPPGGGWRVGEMFDAEVKWPTTGAPRELRVIIIPSSHDRLCATTTCISMHWLKSTRTIATTLCAS